MARLAAVVVLLALAAPFAAASIGEVALPVDSRPLALAFDDDTLWITLDGAWALGAFDPATGNLTLHRLAAPPAPSTAEPGAPGDSLFALRKGPDGAWWTASQANLHRVPPDGNATAYPLPEVSSLSGDIAFAEGKVLVALVTADAIGVFDPADGTWTTIRTPDRFGPLHFAEDTLGALFVTGTYAGEVARVLVDQGRLVPGSGSGLAGPVGVDVGPSGTFVAEMGSSSVARLPSADSLFERFPTSPSPFYPSSGPSDVATLDGGVVWFVEHFADRVAKLDPEEGTLVEWMAPSAPGTNAQRLAVGPDGRVWFAEWSTSKLGWVRDDAPHAFPTVTPATLTVAPGGQAELKVDAPVAALGSVTPGLTARPTADGAAVTVASDAPLGDHLLLVATGARPLLEGRYVRVRVEVPLDAHVPGSPLALALVGLGVAARWRR